LQGLQVHCLPAKAAEAKAPVIITTVNNAAINFFMGITSFRLIILKVPPLKKQPQAEAPERNRSYLKCVAQKMPGAIRKAPDIQKSAGRSSAEYRRGFGTRPVF